MAPKGAQLTSILDQLGALLARFDEEAYVGLSNRGLVRRARKDLARQPVAVVEQSATELVVAFGAHRIRFDLRGPAHAQCDCPASGMCQHILAAAMGLQALQAQELAPVGDVPIHGVDSSDPDALAPLREAGRLVGEVLTELAARVKPGVTTAELDELAERRILRAGGAPAVKGGILSLLNISSTLRGCNLCFSNSC